MAMVMAMALPFQLPAALPWDKKVKLGPLRVSQLGLGTWAWGNKLLWGYDESMDDELQAVFNFAVRKGVNLFDTADSYGTGQLNGRSELLLGRFVREFPGPDRTRDGIVIATKFAAYPWRLTSKQMVQACKASLRRLGIEQLGLGQLHWSTANYAPYQERALWAGLAEMYKEGLVKAIGVSNYGPKQLMRIQQYLEKQGAPLTSAQVQFSLLSTGQAQNELKNLCDGLDIKVIAYSPLGLGLLTGKYTINSQLPTGPRGILFRQILPRIQPLIQAIETISAKRNKTMSQVAINWCICKGTIPIPGVKSLAQAQDNVGALSWRLAPEEVLQLEAAARASEGKMIQNVFQTG